MHWPLAVSVTACLYSRSPCSNILSYQRLPAHAGTAAEMVYPGGELAFVSQMASESRTMGNRIHWYTTMVGKKATLKQLRKQLHAGRVTALRTTEFVQVGLGCRQWQTCC